MTFVAVCDGRATTPVAISLARRFRGHRAHLSGLSAEDCVVRSYLDRGHPVVARRWRGPSGEIDLIVRDGAGYIFVEVKQARSHDAAALRLSRRQMARISMAALEFVGTCPRGSLTDVRFDLALVNGMGQVEVIENLYLDA